MNRSQRRRARRAECRKLGHQYHAGWFKGTAEPPKVEDKAGNKRPINQLVDERIGLDRSAAA